MSFIEKNLQSISSHFTNTFLLEDVPTRKGLLQSIDPRAKIICFIVLLLATNSAKELKSLIIIYFLTLILTSASKIPPTKFVSRVWLVTLFFTGIIVFPSILRISSNSIGIDKIAVYSALFILLRVAISISLSFLLILSTHWTHLLKAFDKLYVPTLFISMILMSYRYIFVILTISNNMFLARKSRKIGKTNKRSENSWWESLFGSLFTKTFLLSNDIYDAMRSRGFNGGIVILTDFRYKTLDYIAVLFIFVFSYITLFIL